MPDVFASVFRLVTLNSFVLVVVMLAAIEVFAQQSQLIAGVTAKEEPPKVGLRVLKVYAGSPAQEVGLKSMDTIVKYGDFAIVDSASYFAARDAMEKFPNSKVEVVYWRGTERFASKVSPGRLGIEFNEHGAVAYNLDSLMQKLNSHLQLPEYFVEGEIAKGTMQPREKLLEDIRAVVDQAILDRTLTPAQILVSKINMIPDDAPAAEIEKQSEMLRELISTQPQSFTDYLAYDIFFEHQRNRAAIECFKRWLQRDPSDVSVRLNLGLAYDRVRMFTAADAAADYVLDNKLGLTEYGHAVALQVKALAALGRRDFAKAFGLAEKAFRADPYSSFMMSLWQLSAAQTGDLQKFYQVIEASEKTLPTEYANLRGRADAVEAYILVKNNQIEKARRLAGKWTETDKLDANARYWKRFPTGEEIVKCWKQLLGRN